MKILTTLVRREFWEHRGLWITPLVVGGVLILSALLSTHGIGRIEINGQELSAMQSMNDVRRAQMFGLIFTGLMVPHMLVILVVLFFYLSDALYGERKDRSILFWKSMPVSDANTVLSKLLTALVAAPLLAFAAAALTATICYAIIKLKYGGPLFDGFVSGNVAMWLQTVVVTLIDIFVAALWYAPLAAYVLLVSAWAKRAVFLWIVLPPLMISIMEKWYRGSSDFADFLAYRMFGILHRMGSSDDAAEIGSIAKDKLAHLGEALDRFNLLPMLGNPDTWLGVLAAAVMVVITIRLRRYRDDTSG